MDCCSTIDSDPGFLILEQQYRSAGYFLQYLLILTVLSTV